MFAPTELQFCNQLPSSMDINFDSCILIYDRILQKKYGAWIKKFSRRIAVRSGESLKALSGFPDLMLKVIHQCDGLAKSEIHIVAFGGGSVGDCAGFIASILKRGVAVVQIPSTWLAAMDSAHGGKTALNVSHLKNQIGGFHFPKKVILVRQVLKDLPRQQLENSLGEFYKMSLIHGGKLWKRAQRPVNFALLWRTLPLLIEAKMKIVKKDPFETKGLRFALNLGHSVGHVLELQLGLPHGRAVHLGLLFALRWGVQLGFWNPNRHLSLLPPQKELKQALRKIKNPINSFKQDKKMAAQDRLNFIFVKAPGRVIARKVHLQELMIEWHRQAKSETL